MFESFKVNSFALMNTAVLSLFSTGKTCGLVAECGEGITYTVPVFEGYALPHAMHYIPVAGRDVTQKLLEELASENVGKEHFQFVKDIKEQMCRVALNFDEEKASGEDHLTTQEQRQYELPDEKIIEVKNLKRITAAEVLFDPSLIGFKYPEFEHDIEGIKGGIAKLAFRSIK